MHETRITCGQEEPEGPDSLVSPGPVFRGGSLHPLPQRDPPCTKVTSLGRCADTLGLQSASAAACRNLPSYVGVQNDATLGRITESATAASMNQKSAAAVHLICRPWYQAHGVCHVVPRVRRTDCVRARWDRSSFPHRLHGRIAEAASGEASRVAECVYGDLRSQVIRADHQATTLGVCATASETRRVHIPDGIVSCV